MSNEINKWLSEQTRNPETSLHFECPCGCNFPMAEFRVNDDELQCPACGVKHFYPKEREEE